jgi:hypothetical protein
MAKIYVDSTVEIEKWDSVSYNIVTSDSEKGLVGILEYDGITKKWFLELEPDYLIGFRTLTQIQFFLHGLGWSKPFCLLVGIGGSGI